MASTKLLRLQDIINTMSIPASRKFDIQWLGRNMGINNGNHPRYNEAMDLIHDIYREYTQPSK